jgi:transposase InsO family protein
MPGECRQVLGRALMAQSMSRPDNCYDNAFQESCFGKLLPIEVYADVRIARKEIRAYLYYYDTKRRHSSLNYLTPCEFEMKSQQLHHALDSLQARAVSGRISMAFGKVTR